MLRGRKFVEYACFRYGYYNAQISGKIGNGFVDDFQYFVFTKSIKSLGSIRELLRLGHVEDVFIILRTSFEGYIASRYIDMRNMFKNMRSSLKEEVGSIKKDFL